MTISYYVLYANRNDERIYWNGVRWTEVYMYAKRILKSEIDRVKEEARTTGNLLLDKEQIQVHKDLLSRPYHSKTNYIFDEEQGE